MHFPRHSRQPVLQMMTRCSSRWLQAREVAYSKSSYRRDYAQRVPRPAACCLPHTLCAHGAITLAATPPMGWNSWNLFAGKVTDKDVRAAADAMVSSGMKDAGYIYVNIDDTWQGDRDAQGNIRANSKFPDMKALADYVHSKGLKIGIYSSPVPPPAPSTKAAIGTRRRMRRPMRPGASTTSSTIFAAFARS